MCFWATDFTDPEPQSELRTRVHYGHWRGEMEEEKEQKEDMF